VRPNALLLRSQLARLVGLAEGLTRTSTRRGDA
jgi:hypothetical protein